MRHLKQTKLSPQCPLKIATVVKDSPDLFLMKIPKGAHPYSLTSSAAPWAWHLSLEACHYPILEH